MKVTELELPGLTLVELDVYRDERGFFSERFSARSFAQHGLPTAFVQDNFSHSRPGVVRGLHFQFAPRQGKLVGATRGRIWDVVVDLRPDSRCFRQWKAVELSADNGRLLWVPFGYAHGFCVLGDAPADVMYKVDALYEPGGEGGVCWNDPALGIPWPVEKPVVSEKDQKLPRLEAISELIETRFRS